MENQNHNNCNHRSTSISILVVDWNSRYILACHNDNMFHLFWSVWFRYVFEETCDESMNWIEIYLQIIFVVVATVTHKTLLYFMIIFMFHSLAFGQIWENSLQIPEWFWLRAWFCFSVQLHVIYSGCNSECCNRFG